MHWPAITCSCLGVIASADQFRTATISGAAAGQVLVSHFECDAVQMNTTSGYMPGVIRKYTPISSAIGENSLSRMYIGFHFRHAVGCGEAMGYRNGDYVFKHALPLRWNQAGYAAHEPHACCSGPIVAWQGGR